MTQTLNGKIAVVTGGSRGIGRAMAKRLASDGAVVIIGYRSNEEKAMETVKSIREMGGKAHAVGGDLSSVAGVEAFYKELDGLLEAQTGKTSFDILIANAGVLVEATIDTTSEADFDYLFNTNVKGVFFLIQKGISRLNDHGRIITLSSGLTRFSYPQYIAYSAAKGAIDVMTRSLAVQLGVRGITVNAMAPGGIETDMLADMLEMDGAREQLSQAASIKRIGQPEDIADVTAFLASENSRWVTGQRIEASGGIHL